MLKNFHRLPIKLAALLLPGLLNFVNPESLHSQEVIPIATEKELESIAPTWETRRQARMVRQQIPAPRGQIVDRHGSPLALSRVDYNLAMRFPDPYGMTEAQVLSFARQQIGVAERLTGKSVDISDENLLRHYDNRALMPLDLLSALTEAEVELIRPQLTSVFQLRPIYSRFYPNGRVAGHIIGYSGRTGRQADGVLQNGELLWPDLEGREGLEFMFNDQLTGRNGELRTTFDENGKLTSERISSQPIPGYNVVTSLDLGLQKICEDVLRKNVKRGAIVITDVATGDILAMASWPSYDPNLFTPTIDPEVFQKLQDDPEIPLLPRAFRSAYPPGSTFKVFVGIAAAETGVVALNEKVECPPNFTMSGLTWRNWKKVHAGSLDLAEALTQSCNTWFYVIGLRVGAANLIDWSQRFGFGRRTGIPLAGEAAGRIPTDEYMLRAQKRRVLQGDVVNMSIGQGEVLASPLQMAQAMGAVANGGALFQARLVQQVQTLNNEVVVAYDTRARDLLNLNPELVKEVHRGLVNVVHSGSGTAGRARVKGLQVAGKTGTAQWGPKKRERTAAWFAGFAPADAPRYAFAAVVEGDVGVRIQGGRNAAPLIGEVLSQALKLEVDRAAADAPELQPEDESD